MGNGWKLLCSYKIRVLLSLQYWELHETQYIYWCQLAQFLSFHPIFYFSLHLLSIHFLQFRIVMFCSCDEGMEMHLSWSQVASEFFGGMCKHLHLPLSQTEVIKGQKCMSQPCSSEWVTYPHQKHIQHPYILFLRRHTTFTYNLGTAHFFKRPVILHSKSSLYS